MKVMVNALSARQGGIVTYTRNLMRSFRDRGVTAIFAVPEQFPTEEGVRLLRLPASQYGAARRFLWEQTIWREMVRSENPDVLYSSANFALSRCPVPQVLLMREGGLFDPLYLANITPQQGLVLAGMRTIRRWVMRYSMRVADLTLTPTEAMRDMLAQWEPRVASGFRVNHYGTLANMFAPSDAPRVWREDGTLRLLYVSVYYPHKCVGLVVEVARRLCEMGIKTHALLTTTLDEIQTTPGNALDYKQVEQGLKEGLITLGHLDYADLPDVYRSHDLFLFPSVSETFGHPMAEALSSGIPIVAADTSVNREICGEAALYHHPFAIEDTCRLVRELDRDAALRARISSIGPGRIKRLFSWGDHVDRLLKALEEAAALKRQ
ncbi:MAG: glycosyltransferase family 1 protein [Rhodospirillales bacterium]